MYPIQFVSEMELTFQVNSSIDSKETLVSLLELDKRNVFRDFASSVKGLKPTTGGGWGGGRGAWVNLPSSHPNTEKGSAKPVFSPLKAQSFR